MNTNYIKSPLSFMGNKYKLLKEIIPLTETEIFVDVFGGSGTVAINSKSENILYNEIDKNTFSIIEMFLTRDGETIISEIEKIIEDFNLIKSTEKNGFDNYVTAREKINNKYIHIEKTNIPPQLIYTLQFFSIMGVMRFNRKGEFNQGYGYLSGAPLSTYKEKLMNFKNPNIKKLTNLSFEILIDGFLKNTDLSETLFYCDPPYLNTAAQYNKNWTIKEDELLLRKLDEINMKNGKFLMSNTLKGKGGENSHLLEWAEKNNYFIKRINASYNSFGKTSIIDEVLIANYDIN